LLWNVYYNDPRMTIFFWRNSRLAGMLCLMLASFLLAWPSPAAAQSTPLPSLSTNGNGFNQPIDVVVVLDDSGSMATCWPWPRDGGQPFAPPCGGSSNNPPSDPGELRYSAARLLLQLAGDDDRIAVIRFDSTAEGVGELGALQPVGDAANRQRLATSLLAPDDYLRRGYTRIDLGLQAANDLLQGAREAGRNQYVLLLTDGEPSGPQGFGGQGEEIRALVTTLNNAGVLVFPVVLCNPTAGCAGEFLREQLPELPASQATTAQELLRVFSELFAEMKPDLSVITGSGGLLQLTTRAEHGVRKLALVTARDGLTALQRDNQPVLAQQSLNDPAIAVNLVEGEALAAGRWRAEMSDAGGFAVVQTDSYPQLLNPPPSLANSPASVRYYPAGKPLLLLARSGGPGASEPLLFDGKTQLQSFAQSELKTLLLNDPPATLNLQLGADRAPLQLVRSFRLEARRDLPRLEVFSPLDDTAGIREDGHAVLQVGFSGGVEVQNLAATVFVTDESNVDAETEGAPGKLVYEAAMTCTDRLCIDENFIPSDGRSYQITYILQAQHDGVRFSDWGQATLGLKPAVQVRGLPNPIDLATMPPTGWPIEISSGTTEEIGSLSAALTLRRTGAEDAVRGVSLNFASDVPETGVVTGTIRIDGLDALRPGEYSGELTFKATRPNGQAMDVQIRPGALLPVSLNVPRPLALIDSQFADFGELLFDTSPNFRLNQELLLPINFAGKRFPITASLKDNSCTDLRLATGDVRTQEQQLVLPIQLSSSGPIPPATCTGAIQLAGPDDDYDVFPQELPWQMRINDVEWSLISGSLNLGDLQDAGARAEAILRIRFNGKTPYIVAMRELNAAGDTPDGQVLLTAEDLEMSPVEITGPPNDAGVYEVPITLIVRHGIPHNPLRGAFYSGEITLGVVGLDNKAQTLDFQFRSPSLAQRYLLPYVAPVYAQLPWALCAWPLTLLILLILVARIRGRGIDDEELAEASVAVVTPLTPALATPNNELGSGHPFATADSDASALFESVWGFEGAPAWAEANEQPATGRGEAAGALGARSYVTNGAQRMPENNDPWQSSW
jgi:hypothetical protein